jgi:uncharacterized protein (TIGR02145 family)
MTAQCGNIAISAPIVACTVSAVSDGSVTCGGQTYKTVVIGTQTWMAENLNYNPGAGNSACYNNQTSNCVTYGRLYDWSTAMGFPSSCNSSLLSNCSSQIQSPHRGICPAGWHIPSQDEWNTLSNYVQNNSRCAFCDASELKATSGWYENGNGTDGYGFSALPGGGGGSIFSSFYNVGYDGYWWHTNVNCEWMRYDRSTLWSCTLTPSTSQDLRSVRCLKD